MPLNIDWQQILLHLFNFLILFSVLYLLLYKPIMEFMNKRSTYFKQMDEKAKKNIEDSTAAQKLYSERMKNADKEIGIMKDKACKEAKELSKHILDEAKTEADNIISKAKVEAEYEHNKMISKAREEISNMVASAATKIIFPDTNSAYENFLNTVEGEKNNEQ